MPNNSNQGHRQRLRERFLKSGFPGLQDYEIIELILTLCIPRSDVKQPAKLLIKRFKTLKGILDAPSKEITQIPGIGPITPIAFKILRETISEYLKNSAIDQDAPVLNSSDKLETFWQSRLSALKNEVFEVAYLDNAYRIMQDGVQRLEEGTVNHTVVYPRKVISCALERSACAIVIAHNHPTGNPTPSDHDIKLTRSLIHAASPLNIEILDHLIIADKEIFSFRRNGLLHSH